MALISQKIHLYLFTGKIRLFPAHAIRDKHLFRCNVPGVGERPAMYVP